MSDQSTSDPAYAPAGSFKGMLQRGRGLGALLALDDPATSAELVYDVVGDDWRWGCGPDRLAAGLSRFGPAAAEAAPVLRRLWLGTPHSYERPAYLKALAALAPAGLDRAYTESLWDCESNARLLGIASAPDGPLVRQRLVRLRDDPMEDPDVRAAAGDRLSTGS